MMATEDWTEPGYARIADLVRSRTGLTFEPNRRAAAEGNIRRAMLRAGVSHALPYCAMLTRDARILDDLVGELRVGETYFFRDAAQFALIRNLIVPDLRRRRGAGAGIRAWSAGCASGEEAYSLAMLLCEEGLGEQSRVRGTDISAAALATARAATYGKWSLRPESGTAVNAHLRREGECYVVEDRIRRMVHFDLLNLALDPYPSFTAGIWGEDLILCRNVLIYLDGETTSRVARGLYESLAPGGWLVTGPSDPPLAGVAAYETIATDSGVVYRRAPGAAVSPSLRSCAPSGVDRRAPLLSAVAVTTTAGPSVAPRAGRSLTRDTLDVAETLAAARRACARGDYAEAVRVAIAVEDDAEASALAVRAAANLDTLQAERVCAAAAIRYPLCVELHYLRAVLLLELDRADEAAGAIRRVLYLDGSLAIAHFALGSILRRRGDDAGARRAYRNAHDLCARRPADELVPLGDGEANGRLAEAAARELTLSSASRSGA
jgi:chemotaxis protein methyltransferase CheR